MSTLYIRGIPEELARQIKADAARYGLTLSQWLAAAYDLMAASRTGA
jgi:plasmid stability protein